MDPRFTTLSVHRNICHFWQPFGSNICYVCKWVLKISWQPCARWSCRFHKCEYFIVIQLFFIWIIIFHAVVVTIKHKCSFYAIISSTLNSPVVIRVTTGIADFTHSLQQISTVSLKGSALLWHIAGSLFLPLCFTVLIWLYKDAYAILLAFLCYFCFISVILHVSMNGRICSGLYSTSCNLPVKLDLMYVVNSSLLTSMYLLVNIFCVLFCILSLAGESQRVLTTEYAGDLRASILCQILAMARQKQQNMYVLMDSRKSLFTMLR